jgi:NTP pyrophosphatase (non-canonical NTP hydrolase)
VKTLQEYQKSVERVMGSDRNERAVYALGLAGEAGEVVDLLKKHWGHNKPLDRASLRLELGDVLWYVTALARQFGFTLEEVADANNQKLLARYPDGFDHVYRPNPPVPAYVPTADTCAFCHPGNCSCRRPA